VLTPPPRVVEIVRASAKNYVSCNWWEPVGAPECIPAEVTPRPQSSPGGGERNLFERGGISMRELELALKRADQRRPKNRSISAIPLAVAPSRMLAVSNADVPPPELGGTTPWPGEVGVYTVAPW